MNDSMPKVSVIMPNHNHAEFIGVAIQSVLDQSYPNIELIIVDNYSTDASLSIIHSFSDNRIQVFQFNNHGIIAAARNFGIKQATGKVIAFLDSDDIWDTTKLTVQLPYLQDLSIAAVTSDFIPIGQIKYSYKHLKLGSEPVRLFNFQEMCLANKVMTSSLLMRKADFEKLGGFDESPDFAFIEDWELWLRLTHEAGKICVLNCSLLYYRVLKKKNRDHRQVSLNTLKIAKKLKDLNYLDEKQHQAMAYNCYSTIAIAHLEAGDRQAFTYYRLTLLKCNGGILKFKAIVGMILALLPRRLSNLLISGLYHLRSQFFT